MEFINSNTRFQQALTYKIWASEFRRQISTDSLNKCFRSPAFPSQYMGKSCSLFGFRQFSSSYAPREKKSEKMLLYLTALVFVMVGSTYAAVPLYRRFCQVTGYGGTIQRREVSLNLFCGVSFSHQKILSFTFSFHLLTGTKFCIIHPDS